MYIIVISIDTIVENGVVSDEFISLYEEFKNNFVFIFVSRRESIRNIIKYDRRIDKQIYITERSEVRKKLTKSEDFKIVLGFKDADFTLSNNIGAIFFKSSWHRREEKAEEYGIQVSYQGLKLVLNMILNNNNFYYKLEIDKNTKLLSILDPRTKFKYAYYKSKEEKELIDDFNEVLKNNKKENLNILKLLFLIMINKSPELKNIKYWTSFPSSKGVSSENMQSIEKEIRYFKGQRGKGKVGGLGDLFIRTYPIETSHKLLREERLGCERHFKSIIVNPEYRGKIKGSEICILDDYATNGTTSEVCRNLLKNEGVEKIYVLTLGKFNADNRADYIYQEYKIDGDIYSPNYGYQFIDMKYLNGSSLKTSEEIKELYRFISE